MKRMMLLTLVTLLSIAMSGGTLANADSDARRVSKAQAIAKVRKMLKRHAAGCDMTIIKVVARSKPGRWRVTSRVSTFGNVGNARWGVRKKSGKITPEDQLAYEIYNDCP